MPRRTGRTSGDRTTDALHRLITMQAALNDSVQDVAATNDKIVDLLGQLIDHITQKQGPPVPPGRGGGVAGGGGGPDKDPRPIELSLLSTQKGLFEAINDLRSVFQQSVGAVAQFQETALAFNRVPSQFVTQLETAMPDIPGVTQLSVGITALKTGLDKNITGVGKFLARTELLGENVQAVANDIRSLTNSFLLTRTQQSELIQALTNTADTFEVSLQDLVSRVSNIAKELPLQAIQGNRNLIEAIGQFEARIGPGVEEGTTRKIIAQFAAGTFDVAGLEAQLGLTGFADELNDSSRTVAQQLATLEAFFKTAATEGKGFIDSIGDTRAILSNFGNAIQPVRGAIAVQTAIEQGPDPQAVTEANFNRTIKSINSLSVRLLEPIVNIGKYVLEVIDSLGKTAATLVSISVITATVGLITKSLLSLGAINMKMSQIIAYLRTGNKDELAKGLLSSFTGLKNLINPKNWLTGIKSIFTGGFSGIKNLLSKGLSGIFGGIFRGLLVGLRGLFAALPFGAILTVLSFLPDILNWIGGSSEETADSTGQMAGDLKPKLEAVTSRQLLNQEAALIGALNRVPELSLIAAKATTNEGEDQLMVQQNGYLDTLVRSFKSIQERREPASPLMRRGIGPR